MIYSPDAIAAAKALDDEMTKALAPYIKDGDVTDWDGFDQTPPTTPETT